MARYTVEVVQGGSLDRLRNLGTFIRQALVRIGQFLTNRAQQTFPLQGANRQGKWFPWPPRSNPNYPAIIEDLRRKSTLPQRRFEDRPAVMDLGRLMASINWRLVDKSTVEVGTNLPYASMQQFGGTRDININKTVHDNLAKYLRRNPLRRPQLAWLFHRTAITWHVIPRPFVVIDAQDAKDIDQVVLESVGAV